MRACLNPQVAAHRTAVRPLAQGPKASVEPHGYSKSRLAQASQQLDPATLIIKLKALKEEQESQIFLKFEKLHRSVIEKLTPADKLTRPLPPQIEDDDQAILDLHVQRVFSPNFSPGTISPMTLSQRYHHRPSEMSTSMPDFGKSAIVLAYFVLKYTSKPVVVLFRQTYQF